MIVLIMSGVIILQIYWCYNLYKNRNKRKNLILNN